MSALRADPPETDGPPGGRGVAQLGRHLADTALEATVLGSWSRAGIAVRRRVWGWNPEPVGPASLAASQILVTGGTGGIGKATAIALARAGASVGIVGRDRDRTERSAEEIRRTSGTGAAVWAEDADLSSRRQVEALAGRVAERVGSLRAVVHAAGVMGRAHRFSADGTEMTVAVHVVASHLLTARLAPLLGAGAPSTVVFVSSGGMYLQALDVANLEMPAEAYRGTVAYARAKRAQVALAHLWAEQLGDLGVASVAMHPGWVETGALRQGLPRFAAVMGPLLRTPAEGADTVAWLASGAAGSRPAPAFWLDRRRRSERRWPGPASPSSAERDRLWAWCEEKTAGAGATETARVRAAVTSGPGGEGAAR